MDIELKAVLKSSILLLVEDDIRIIEKFSRLLEIYVGTIYTATNGKDALKLYKKFNPQFIITDFEMPVMNGLQFIEYLRNENSTVPIIAISAHTNIEYLLNSIKLKLVDYLLKPVDSTELIKSLESVAKELKSLKLSNIIDITEEIKYNPIEKNLIINDKNVSLTVNESKVFELLLINRGNIVTKQMVEEKIYIFKEMGESALKNVIYKLRKKINSEIIVSVKRLGYKID